MYQDKSAYILFVTCLNLEYFKHAELQITGIYLSEAELCDCGIYQ